MHVWMPERGGVKIPGFYDDVVSPSSREMEEFLSSGFEVSRFKKAFGFRAIRTEDRAQLIKPYLGRSDV